MSNDAEFSEWIDWIEEAISKKHIRYYEYENFNDIKEIGCGGFGKVYRANWKNSHTYLALKSFFNLDYVTVEEVVHEVIITIIYSIFPSLLIIYSVFTLCLFFLPK